MTVLGATDLDGLVHDCDGEGGAEGQVPCQLPVPPVRDRSAPTGGTGERPSPIPTQPHFREILVHGDPLDDPLWKHEELPNTLDVYGSTSCGWWFCVLSPAYTGG